MATRIYLPSSGSPAITPSTWNFGAQINPVTLPGSLTKTSTAMTSKTEATGTTNPTARAMLRYVIGPLAGQTISGTLKGQMRCSESNAGANATLAIAVKLVQPGGADRSVLLAQTASDSAAAPNEMVTTLTNSRFRNAAESASLTLTSQTATEGDYLVIEIGFRSATGTTRNITLRYGDTGGTDLAEDDSTTTDNVPWVEFSANILPVTYGTLSKTQGADTATGAASVGITGTGTPTQAADTSTGIGEVAISGSGAATQAAQTATGEGTVDGGGSTPVEFRSISSTAPDASSTTTIAPPTGLQDDDVLLAALISVPDGFPYTSAPSGWTLVNEISAAAHTLSVWRKVASGESGNYSFTSAGASFTGGVISAYSGADTTTPIDVSGADNNGNSNAPSALSVTTTVADAMLVFIAGIQDAGALTPPSGMTERIDPATAYIGVSDVIQASAGASGAKTASRTGSAVWSAMLVALTPGGGGGSIDGSGSVTQGAQTVASGGTVAIGGSGTPTQGAQTSSGAGEVENIGTAAPTQEPQTVVSQAEVPIAGVGAGTQGADTVDAEGDISDSGNDGSAAVTQGPDTAVGTGEVSTAGQGTRTQGPDTGSGVGTVENRGDGSPTQDPQTVTSQADVGVQGAGTPTQDPQTGSGLGLVGVEGDGSADQSDQTVVSQANVSVEGQSAVTQGPDAGEGDGSVAIGGQGAPQQAADGAEAGGAVGITGQGNITEEPDTLVATGGQGGIQGSADITQGPQVGIGTGSVSIEGSADEAQAPHSVEAAGDVNISGSGDVVSAEQTASGTGQARIPFRVNRATRRRWFPKTTRYAAGEPIELGTHRRI